VRRRNDTPLSPVVYCSDIDLEGVGKAAPANSLAGLSLRGMLDGHLCCTPLCALVIANVDTAREIKRVGSILSCKLFFSGVSWAGPASALRAAESDQSDAQHQRPSEEYAAASPLVLSASQTSHPPADGICPRLNRHAVMFFALGHGYARRS
jgi:hypothetical protein